MTEYAVSHTSGIPQPKILDLATGPGEPAKSIAIRMPHAHVIASDTSEDMVDAASENTKDVDNLMCLLADMQNLSSLESNSIDVVTCCYGYMFPTDKAAALAETLRVLKPGGALIATTWDVLDMLKLCKDVMRNVLGHDPPPPPLNPMSLSEEGIFRNLLDDAGFVDIEQSTSTYPFNLGSDKEMQFTMGSLLLRQRINEVASEGDNGAWKRAEVAFWKNAEKYATVQDSGDLVMPGNSFRLTISKKRKE